MEKKKKIYFGWWIVLVSFLVMALVYAPSLSLVGLFVSPIATEFETNRTAVGTMITLGIFGAAFGSLFAGKVLSKFPMRKIVSLFLLILALCYLGMSFATSLVMLYTFSFIRGVIGAASSMVPISMIINNWFGSQAKGKAVSLAMIGSGIGAILLSPVAGAIISNFGWRQGYLFFGALIVIVVPLVFLTFINSPESMNLEKIGVDHAANEHHLNTLGLSVAAVLKSATFWIIFVSLLFIAGTSQSWNNNGASFLGDIGFSGVHVSGIISGTALGTTLGKLLLGWIYDKWDARIATIVGVIFLMLGYGALVFSETAELIAIIAAFLIGVGMATISICLPLLASELFGNKSYGTLVGYLQIASSLGASFLPLATAMIFDASNSFIPAWIGLIVLSVLTIFLVNIAYRFSEKEPLQAEEQLDN